MPRGVGTAMAKLTRHPSNERASSYDVRVREMTQPLATIFEVSNIWCLLDPTSCVKRFSYLPVGSTIRDYGRSCTPACDWRQRKMSRHNRFSLAQCVVGSREDRNRMRSLVSGKHTPNRLLAEFLDGISPSITGHIASRHIAFKGTQRTLLRT